MFSESGSEIQRHDICLYTGGLRVGRIDCIGQNYPHKVYLSLFRSKISIFAAGYFSRGLVVWAFLLSSG